MDLETLKSILSSGRIPHSTEREMQEAVAALLTARGVSFIREARLSPKDIVDFLVGDIAVECKVKGRPLVIHRQVERYLLHDEVSAVIIVTAKSMGTTGSHNGKPIVVVAVGRAWL